MSAPALAGLGLGALAPAGCHLSRPLRADDPRLVTKPLEKAVEKGVPALFEPDTMLASQYFDRVRRRVEHEGARRLMLAILEDAVNIGGVPPRMRDPAGRAGSDCRIGAPRTLLCTSRRPG